MPIKLNSAGNANAKAKIAAGEYDSVSKWNLTPADENAILGDGNWTEYTKWFLAIDDSVSKETKGYYKYPFGDGKKVYASALRAILSRAGQQNESEIQNAADKLYQELKDKDEKKLFEHYSHKAVPPQIVRLKNGVNEYCSAKATIRMKADEGDAENRIITSLISTITPDRNQDVMIPGGINLKNFYENPVVLWMHDDTIPAVAKCVGIQTTASGVIAKTFFNLKTQLSKDLYALYSDEDMLAYSIGFIPEEYEIVEVGMEEQDFGGGTMVRRPKTECHYKRWELLEYSLVNIPMNAEAVTLSLTPEADLERIVRKAISKGRMSAESETIKILGLDATIKTAQINPPAVAKTLEERVTELENNYSNIISPRPNMEQKKLSNEDVKSLAGHVQKLCKGLVIHKDAMSDHVKAMGLHKDGMDAEEKAIQMHKDAIQEHKDALVNHTHSPEATTAHKDAIESHEDALKIHKDGFELHKDAFHVHSKAFGKHKEAFEHGQEAVKGIHGLMKDKGYDAWDINDDVTAATEPFHNDETTGGGPSGQAANVWPTPKAFSEAITKAVEGVLPGLEDRIVAKLKPAPTEPTEEEKKKALEDAQKKATESILKGVKIS